MLWISSSCIAAAIIINIRTNSNIRIKESKSNIIMEGDKLIKNMDNLIVSLDKVNTGLQKVDDNLQKTIKSCKE